ncbi:MAG: hypothetical protein ACLPWS_02290 [Rhodomicrobium sp.]
MSRLIAGVIYVAAIVFIAQPTFAQSPAKAEQDKNQAGVWTSVEERDEQKIKAAEGAEPQYSVILAEHIRAKREQAIEDAKAKLSQAERAFGKRDPQLVKLLIALAQAYEADNVGCDGAQPEYKRALAILKKAPGKYRAEIIEVSEALKKYAWCGQEVSFSIGESDEDAQLPDFPWPPPAASTAYVIPASVFTRYTTVGEVSAAILYALEDSGYVERSFFQTKPGGVAIVTRLERIVEDGSPAAGADRWPTGFRDEPRGLADFLHGLFFVKTGHYRVIVFTLQDLPFKQGPEGLTGEAAKAWLKLGVNSIPRQMANRPHSKDSTCTVLIYEFESNGKAVKAIDASSVPGKQHLEKAGLLAALR